MRQTSRDSHWMLLDLLSGTSEASPESQFIWQRSRIARCLLHRESGWVDRCRRAQSATVTAAPGGSRSRRNEARAGASSSAGIEKRARSPTRNNCCLLRSIAVRVCRHQHQTNRQTSHRREICEVSSTASSPTRSACRGIGKHEIRPLFREMKARERMDSRRGRRQKRLRGSAPGHAHHCAALSCLQSTSSSVQAHFRLSKV